MLAPEAESDIMDDQQSTRGQSKQMPACRNLRGSPLAECASSSTNQALLHSSFRKLVGIYRSQLGRHLVFCCTGREAQHSQYSSLVMRPIGVEPNPSTALSLVLSGKFIPNCSSLVICINQCTVD
jgi:hypothetical protein